MKKRILTVLAVALSFVALLAVLFNQKLQQKEFKPAIEKSYLIRYQPAKELVSFYLTNHQKKPVTKATLKEHWSLIFIGYTYCPDICPTTLSMLKSAYAELSAISPVQVIFVSVDPSRDTPERLNQYIHYFHNDFIAATAPHVDLYPFVQNLGFAYAIHDDKRGANYLVDHSASIAIVNPDGKIQVSLKPKPSAHGYAPTVEKQQLVNAFAQAVSDYKTQ